MNRWLKPLISGGLVLGLGVALWLVVGINNLQSRAMIGPDESAQVIEILPGSSFHAIKTELHQRELIQSPLLFTLYARINGLTPKLQAGEYAIEPGLTPAALLARLADGEVIQYDLTVIEGWRFDDLLAVLRAHPAINQTLPAQADGQAVMAAIGRPGQHPEGRFLPETYRFPRGIADIDLLRRANRALEAELATVWAQRSHDLPLQSPEEALILASIIEKETGRADERTRIAGVFIRRLEQGMRLQTDPTVIYGLGEAFDGDLRRIHLRTDTPYNTYTREGLPPTPIALPGAAALRAAVNPAEGSSLFFVSRGDGSHVFSETYDEHRAAVQRYQLQGKE